MPMKRNRPEQIVTLLRHDSAIVKPHARPFDFCIAILSVIGYRSREPRRQNERLHLRVPTLIV
jgi:hypothetical protein